jgi:hypothetical protein
MRKGQAGGAQRHQPAKGGLRAAAAATGSAGTPDGWPEEHESTSEAPLACPSGRAAQAEAARAW